MTTSQHFVHGTPITVAQWQNVHMGDTFTDRRSVAWRVAYKDSTARLGEILVARTGSTREIAICRNEDSSLRLLSHTNDLAASYLVAAQPILKANANTRPVKTTKARKPPKVVRRRQPVAIRA